MKGAIIQPSFLPWRGFFDIIQKVDIFVFLDDVQFDKHSWRNRNQIRTPQGVQWITVPVLTKGRFGQKILETKIRNDSGWSKKLLQAIYCNYRKARYFDFYYSSLKKALSQKWNFIADLDIYLIEEAVKMLNLKKRFLRSSELKLNIEDKNLRVIEVCRHLGVNSYLSGPAAKNYIKEDLYGSHGISVEYMSYEYPPYKQLYDGFEPYVSIIDLLFNEGPESSRYIWD